MEIDLDKLRDIQKRMEVLASCGDTENDHMAADSLLLEAIILLAEGATDGVWSAVHGIIRSYQDVPKWYA